MSSPKPVSSADASSGSASRQSSGLKPATSLTPPIVVRGSRSDATAGTTSAAGRPSTASNSRYACEAVPRAKMPTWGLRVDAMRLPTQSAEQMQAPTLVLEQHVEPESDQCRENPRPEGDEHEPCHAARAVVGNVLVPVEPGDRERDGRGRDRRDDEAD